MATKIHEGARDVDPAAFVGGGDQIEGGKADTEEKARCCGQEQSCAAAFDGLPEGHGGDGVRGHDGGRGVGKPDGGDGKGKWDEVVAKTPHLKS
jgi:hypothetical protein